MSLKKSFIKAYRAIGQFSRGKCLIYTWCIELLLITPKTTLWARSRQSSQNPMFELDNEEVFSMYEALADIDTPGKQG